jgi:hypothetical protein
MKRRDFLQSTVVGAAFATQASAGGKAVIAPRLDPLPADVLAGCTRMASIEVDGTHYAVWEDLRDPDGDILYVAHGGALRLAKRTEAMTAGKTAPYCGLTLRDVALADADLLADRLLVGRGDPDPEQVREAAPPSGSNFDATKLGARLAWTSFVGTRQADDTMPVFENSRTRTFRPEHAFPELSGDEIAHDRREGLLGGWLPAVHKIIPQPDGGHWDLIVFADVDVDKRFVVQTWHRTQRVENGRVTKSGFGYSYAPYPPRREPPAAEAFYTALFRFACAWQADLADTTPVALPDQSWGDMVSHAFAKELVVRPGGSWPKYGAVDRDYYGAEYDAFQDTFTSSLYANLVWGRFEQARTVLDQYFTTFVGADGMVDMRGPETPQYGLTLALLARYQRLTGDFATLARHRGKIGATATLLAQLHDQSLALPRGDRGYGLIHGWDESDSCLHPDPTLWWKPYWSNSAFTVRGWREIAAVWPSLGGTAHEAADWSQRADALQTRLVEAMRANVRRDLKPAYVGPLPGAVGTFREALAQGHASEQGWAHRTYAELLQAGTLPPDLDNLVVDCLRGHGGTTMGVVANISRPNEHHRDILGFISYGYAEALLRLDRIEEYLLFLYAHRYHAHTPGSWVAGEVSGITGGLPLFCIPAQLTIPLLVRWMLVYEDQDAERLYLGRALPTAWIESGKRIAIDQAPTRWGRVGFTLRMTAPGHRIEGEVRLPLSFPAETHLRIRLTKGRRIVRATAGETVLAVSGDRRDTLILPRGGGTRAVVVEIA